MNVDEALTIAETVLDEVLDEADPLNNVQEIIFRECWQGRRSYEAIAHVSGYEKEYLKSIGAKLWQQLSDAFGEKVKKSNVRSVIRRYAQQHDLKPRNLAIEVNFSGASISGEHISGENILGPLSEAHFCVNDSPAKKNSDEKTTTESKSREIHNKTYQWNGWQFASKAEVKIAAALDRAGVLFFPNAQGRFSSSNGRENSEAGFLICHRGKWGLLIVKDSRSHFKPIADDERSHLYLNQGIHLITDYDATECMEQSDRIVEDFLNNLNHAE
jgi:hypothetical protein